MPAHSTHIFFIFRLLVSFSSVRVNRWIRGATLIVSTIHWMKKKIAEEKKSICSVARNMYWIHEYATQHADEKRRKWEQNGERERKKNCTHTNFVGLARYERTHTVSNMRHYYCLFISLSLSHSPHLCSHSRALRVYKKLSWLHITHSMPNATVERAYTDYYVLQTFCA